MLHAIISACWVDLQYGKKRDRNGRGKRGICSKSYTTISSSSLAGIFCIVSSRLLRTVQVFFVAPRGGVLPRPGQHHVLEKGRSGALRRICVSCLSNASSSEAMFLLKPLKELRAKRKGTHFCLSACVCASEQLCFKAFPLSENDSHRQKDENIIFSRWVSGPVCLFCSCLVVKAFYLSFLLSYFPAVLNRSVGTNA